MRHLGLCFFLTGEQRADLERALTESQRDEFEDMLRALTLERSQIREAMGFALDNSEAAGEVNNFQGPVSFCSSQKFGVRASSIFTWVLSCSGYDQACRVIYSFI